MINITTTQFSTPIFNVSLAGESDLIGYREQDYYGNQLRSDLQHHPSCKRLCTAIQDLIKFLASDTYEYKDRYEFEITQMWLTVLAPGDYFHPHIHPNAYWSGVFFTEDNSQEDLPPVIFENPVKRQLSLSSASINTFNASSITMPYVKDTLVVFPAHLSHYVPVNKSKRDRTSISFNVLPRGYYEEPQNLAWVKI